MTKAKGMHALLSIGLTLATVSAVVALNRANNNDRSTQIDAVSAYNQFPDREADAYWAKRVMDGGLILHVRHATREKWNDVTAFDALEFLNGQDASTESYAKATCLTPQGIEEAKMMGRVFDALNIKVASIHSSPSCRARQTAMNAWGTEGTITPSLLHRSAISSEQHGEFRDVLRDVILDLNVPEDGVAILSGHGGTLGYDGSELIDEYHASVPIDSREEGGIAVLEIREGKIHVHHVFVRFSNFANEAIRLPVGITASKSAALTIIYKPIMFA